MTITLRGLWSKYKLWMIAIALGVAVYVVYYGGINIVDRASSKVTNIIKRISKPVTDTITGDEGDPSLFSFPVTVQSNPEAIKAAFKESGYLSSLETGVKAGTYPTSYLTDANGSPQSWLETHPFLFSRYPKYFSAIEQNVRTGVYRT